ncbi:Fimbrin [Serendipita indica DSM 11827]|uniref:Probable SAC6-actin filament bundling protein, fimbrin n=1 Tax=Serendipita indica (strain DSM 11827) TaxID=1109443 RepID=G4TKI6_SERID|nr:Fimbrin [Serendipita indica DSM 11827]CCA71836.1 probable SAC6-actin filament bundling protein, fimbrin [Serendipita indica DSM 11827]
MAFRRYDVQSESAQSSWARRRASLPPTGPAATAAEPAAAESNPQTPEGSPKAPKALLYEAKRRPSWGVGHRRSSSSSTGSQTNLIPIKDKPAVENPAMQALKLQKKYAGVVTQEEMLELINKFNAIDTDSTGRVTKTAVINAIQSSGAATYDRARETLKDVSVDASGKVELEDWVELNVKLKQQAQPVLPTRAGKVTVKGSNANVSHTINEDEREQFTSHINGVLEGDEHIGSRLPIPTNNMQIFDECRDGLLLCKLINDSVPDTIDIRVLNMPTAKRPLNNFQMTENNNIVITSAKAIGCSVVNIGSSDIAEGREHLILGLIWQIIRRGLLKHVDIKIHPELYRLCEEGETIDDLLKLTPDQILIRWFNYHLKAAGWHRRVANFSKDVSDGENYTVLLNQLKPDECSRDPLKTTDKLKRAEQVLQNADKIGCRKYLTPPALVAGNPRLNLAFVANLFNTWPCLEPLEPGQDLGPVDDFDAEGEREARVFTLWLNSLDVDPPVYNLFQDLKNGVVILSAFDKVAPGSVVWRRVSKPRNVPGSQDFGQSPPENEDEEETGVTPNMPQLSRFKCVENTNYAVDLAKANGMHLVGIQGADIVDGKKTLVLGLVWQLMRLNITKTLTALSGNNKPISDTEILKWANSKVATKPGSKPIRSFKDPSISTGIWFLDLLDAMKPGIVDYSLVSKNPQEYEEKRQNAKLAISIARKMNALIFLVPEDIVDVRAKLILTFVGSLMSLKV